MKSGSENRTRVGRKQAGKSKLRVRLKVRPKVDLKSELRRDIKRLKLVLNIVEAVKESVGEHISISAVEVLARVALADIQGVKLTATDLSLLLGARGNPKSKSTVHRNISIFTGRSQNKYRTFKLVQQISIDSNKRSKELSLTQDGYIVISKLLEKLT